MSGDGAVYPDFDKSVHVISPEQAKGMIFDRYLAGVDWGWEHFGGVVVIGVKGDAYYVIEEHAAQHKYIGEWICIAKDIIRRYGNIPFIVIRRGRNILPHFRRRVSGRIWQITGCCQGLKR